MSTLIAPVGSYDGLSSDELAVLLGAPRVVAFDAVGSTMDIAHELAAHDAPSGTLVLADTQHAGRGRGGKRWTSEAGKGIWLTLIERELDTGVIDLLALRLGIAAAEALDAFSMAALRVKWPNDLYTPDGKVAGILVEARWRDGAPEWVAIGVGVNLVAPPDAPNAAGLRPGVGRVDVLAALVPALREALSRQGSLGPAEREALARRDLATGRAIVQPGIGIVEGIAATGELIVRGESGSLDRYRSGSLVFREDA